MAKKARNRRSGRVARQKERLDNLQKKVDAGTATDEEIELLEELKASELEDEEIEGDEVVSEEDAEAIARANAVSDDDDDKKKKKDAKDDKPAVRHKSALRKYLDGVRLEMRRVTWPTREEMVKYSVSSIAMLIMTGGAVWAIDNGIIAAIIAFSGLRP